MYSLKSDTECNIVKRIAFFGRFIVDSAIGKTYKKSDKNTDKIYIGKFTQKNNCFFGYYKTNNL